jgi:hypothetical protein
MRAVAAALAACLLAAGCGDSDESASNTPTATATATAKASPTAFAPSAPEPPENGPEAEPGGAGDEEPISQQVRMTVDRARAIRPRRVKVSGFLAVNLAIRNRSGGERLISIAGPGLKRGLQIGAGLTVATPLEGLRPGAYRIEVEDGGRATLIASIDEP